jgi:hypothetical protein
MVDINKLRNELSLVATDIYLCRDSAERECLIKKADKIVEQIPSDDAMVFFQWRHCGTA